VYSVYYHIYAGTNDNPYTGYEGIHYSVFLLNDFGDAYYLTDGQCNRNIRADVPSGQMVDKNVDCVAPTGFNQVCVDINGQRECGFGKVTSAFSLNWLNDQVVKREMNKGIDSEEECVPDKEGEGLGSILGLPGTGIARVCSTSVP